MSSRTVIGESFDPAQVQGSDAFLNREFPMSGGNFKTISGIAYKESGIVLADAKQEMVYSRLARRLRELKIKNFDDYLHYLKRDAGDESRNFLNAITTNLTSFFREGHHFEHLKDVAIPELKRQHQADKRIRVWCTAASTGEEPYSIAMVLREAFPVALNWDVKILATDIDSNVLETASIGKYSIDRIEDIDIARKKKWFKKLGKEEVEVDESLKEIITFRQLNLLQDWPMKGPFDVVFCRNVIIYFDKETQKILFGKISKLMLNDSHLYIGHSESLLKVSDQFSSLGSTIYKKK